MSAALPPPSPWLPVSPCTPGCLPVASARTAGVRLACGARVVRRGLLVALLLGLAGLVALAAPVLGPGAVTRVQRRWALALLAAAGVRLRRTGCVPLPTGDGVGRGGAGDGGVLVVANHVSWLDVLALHAVGGVRMLAKDEVRTWPLIGTLAARAGTVFLDRERLRELPVAVDTLTGVVRGGGVVGVFPEGTTRCGRRLGSFRPAAFQAAVDGDVAVQPVALRYGDGAAAFVGDDTLFSSLRRVLPLRRLEVELTVLAPLVADPAAGPGRAAARRDLARRAETAVADALLPGGRGPGAAAARAVARSRPAPASGVLDRAA